ncbi:MAG: hypothetical protein Q9226_006941, partial [Calogaya cf. arnoldii]
TPTFSMNGHDDPRTKIVTVEKRLIAKNGIVASDINKSKDAGQLGLHQALDDLQTIKDVHRPSVSQDGRPMGGNRANWSPENMPDILYVYKSPKERDDFNESYPRRPEPKYIGHNIMFEKWPIPGKGARKLLNFLHLPDQIGTNEYWWSFEAWRRLDPRITWDDIHMRQYGPNRVAHSNTLQRLVSRNRTTAMMVAWPQPKSGCQGLRKANEKKRVYPYDDPLNPESSNGRTRGEFQARSQDKTTKKSKGRKNKTIKPTDLVTPRMTEDQKERNTTRGLTPGLIHPELGEIPGNRVPWPEQSHRAGRHRRNRPPLGPSRAQSSSIEGSDASEVEEDSSGDDVTENGEDQLPKSSGADEEEQEESSGQVQLAQGSSSADTGALPGVPVYEPTSYVLQNVVDQDPWGSFRAGGQTIPSLNEDNSWPYVTSPRLGPQPDSEGNQLVPGNFGFRDPALEVMGYSRFPTPSDTMVPAPDTEGPIDRHDFPSSTPMTITNPTHPLFNLPFTRALSATPLTPIAYSQITHHPAPSVSNAVMNQLMQDIPSAPPQGGYHPVPATLRAPRGRPRGTRQVPSATQPIQQAPPAPPQGAHQRVQGNRRGPSILNLQPVSFFRNPSQASRANNGQHHAPPAVASPQAQTTSGITAHNANQNPATAAATLSAPSTNRITPMVKQTCPDDLTPARWADFLEFCLAKGIPERSTTHQSTSATGGHTLSRANSGRSTAHDRASTSRPANQTQGRGQLPDLGSFEWSDEDEDEDEEEEEERPRRRRSR